MTDSSTGPSIKPSVRSRPRSRAVIRGVVLAVWAAVVLLIGGYLLSEHLLTLPKPDIQDLGPQRSAVAQRKPSQLTSWLVVHILDQDCKCSMDVLDHLLADPRPAGVTERVVLIGGEVGADRLAAVRARGFDLEIVTPDELATRYRVEAAPLLIVLDPADAVRYVGGYTSRKQAADVQDVKIVEALRRGDRVEPLPTFGCVVGRSLRDKIDPLGIRSWK